MSHHNKPLRPMPLPNGSESDAKSEVAEEAKKGEPINVVALRAGFYKCQRKVEGDKFSVDSEAQIGTWMKKI